MNKAFNYQRNALWITITEKTTPEIRVKVRQAVANRYIRNTLVIAIGVRLRDIRIRAETDDLRGEDIYWM